MRVPEFVVVALTQTISQSAFLTMNLAGAKFKASDGTLSDEFDSLIALASRIDSLIEEKSYELAENDRQIFSSDKMIPTIHSVRQDLENRFQRKQIDFSQFEDDSGQKDYQEMLEFLNAAEYAFEKIHAEQLVHDLWKSFLAGEDPTLEDYDYAFEIKASAPPTCNFCGKEGNEVKKIIAGPSCFICDECVGLCNDILETPST